MEDNNIMPNELEANLVRNFDLSSFVKSKDKMIATNDNAYRGRFEVSYDRLISSREYTMEEIERIIASGTLSEQQKLSRHYFYKDGYYKQIVIYYATLLRYMGLLIPNPSVGKNLSTSHIQKRYYRALDYVESMNLPITMTNCAWRAIVDGCYYGVKVETKKDKFALLDLPSGYAISQFKDAEGNDIIEFDLSYFRTIADADARKMALNAYPKEIAKAFEKWDKGKRKDKWFIIPSEIGVCFPFFGGRPLFLNVIPATIQYDEAVLAEREKEAEEVRKIIIQKIPHLSDGRLLFEPDEAAEIHMGTVGMMKKNRNVSVLTTYGDVEVASSRGTDKVETVLERMEKNIYSQAGTSGQIFNGSGSSLEDSLNNDLALMMYLANKQSLFITNTLNHLFSNGDIHFTYKIMPITLYNAASYVETSFKLLGSGYSALATSLGVGLSQRDIVNIKDLENDVLKLGDRLKPLATSYTQSGSDAKAEDGEEKPEDGKTPKDGNSQETPEEGGRPKKKESDKAEQTIKNEQSKERTEGGS
jgi:hypothetical protein